MDDNNNEVLIKEDLLDTLNNFNPSPKITSTITSDTNIKDSREEYNKHLIEIKEFIDSFESCNVSNEIMGEWNVIKKDINNYLFHYNIQFDGSCPKMKEFYLRELEHLNSIKNKLGSNAIEYQMICSLVAESVILDIESSLILVKNIGIPNRNDYTGRLINNHTYCNTLKDCLNVLGNIAPLNMEYQYKYERFTPFYKSLSEKGKQAGLVENDENETKNKKNGCLGTITFLFVCSFLYAYFIF